MPRKGGCVWIVLVRLCLFTQHSNYQNLTSTAHQVLEVDKTEVLGEIAYAVARGQEQSRQ